MTEKNMTCLLYYPSKYFDFKYLSRCFTSFCILILHWGRRIIIYLNQYQRHGIRNCNACLLSSKYHSQTLWFLDKQSETLWNRCQWYLESYAASVERNIFPQEIWWKVLKHPKNYIEQIYICCSRTSWGDELRRRSIGFCVRE